MRFTAKWRILALLTILLFGLSLAAWLILALHNLLFLVIFGLTILVFGYAAWLVFSGEGKRYHWGQLLAILSTLAITFEVWFFGKQSGNLKALIIALALGALYAYFFSFLRRHYWQARRQSALTVKPSFNKPVLVINPKSGGGRALKAHIKEIAEQRGIKVVMMNKGQTMEALARQAVARGADVIGVSGGDGSIGAVAKVALEHDLPMVVLPGGTRCHFARDIGLDPKRIADALTAFEGVERRIDVGSINDRVFLNNASLGLYADIVDHPDYRDNKVTVTRRVLRNLASGKTPPYDLEFKSPDQSFAKAVAVLIGVNEYDTIDLLELGRRGRLDGGVLQINVITRLDDAMIRHLLRNVSLKVFKKQLGDFYQWDAKEFKLTSRRPTIHVGVDGENEQYKSPITVKCLPGALKLFVPPEGERAKPHNLFSRAMLVELWHGVIGKA